MLFVPYFLLEEENFNVANSLETPLHIIPEWYFLFAYAILRAIPNKLGGVLALFARVIIFYTLPFVRSSIRGSFHKYLTLVFFGVFLVLTWLGSCSVEEPYTQLSVFFRCLYFGYFFFLHLK